MSTSGSMISALQRERRGLATQTQRCSIIGDLSYALLCSGHIALQGVGLEGKIFSPFVWLDEEGKRQELVT